MKNSEIFQLTKCESCPRKCGINRNEKNGFCGVKKLKVAKVYLHKWEEPPISGTNGSGTIFFSGCNLKCVYCQNSEISFGAVGKEITVERLVEIFKELELKKAHNINLVTPTPHVFEIIEALKIYKPKIPIVYNTSGYESEEIIKLLKDYVDIYLTDLKYYDKKLSKTLSGAENYFEVATKAILQMRKNQPEDVFDDNGIMQKGVIIRHLVLPSCTNDSVKILDWIFNNLGDNTIISIMGQYVPCFKANGYDFINKKLKPIEYKRVVNYFNLLGFKNGFMQSLDSASDEYIPSFDLEGV